MSFFTIPKPVHKNTPVQKTYVDILYDHTGYLRSNQGKLGPGNLHGKKVCVVGAGPAGLAAAYLLNQQGAAITLFEASDRVGGRVDSLRPKAGDPALFELGAMRVPPSEQLFGYFWKDVFKLPPSSEFPDPGKVDTKIVFQNRVYNWAAGGKPPAIFNNVSAGWSNFTEMFGDLISDLCDPSKFDKALPKWQKLIYQASGKGPEQGYSTISFFQGLVQAFVEHPAKYGCKAWTAEDFALFGALGLGSGGFGPLYSVNFAEIVRLVVNGLETNQQFYSAGLASLVNAFAAKLPKDTIHLQRKVTAVSAKGGVLPQEICVTSVNTAGVSKVDHFDYAVIATTTRAMQVDMDLTEPSGSGQGATQPITNAEATAVQQLHLMNSSKLFVLTKTKFWNASPDMPQNIQTDGLVRGLYCLDYPQSKHGVVLVSYTWGDDSTKYIAIKDPKERFELLLRSLAPYSELAPFVSKLRSETMDEHTTLIDWQDQKHYYGAFKLNLPGQDLLNQNLYYQFLRSTNGIFLAGDSVGWCGGWIEGALQTGMNAAAAVVKRACGESGLGKNSPMTQNPKQYSYGP